MQSDLRLRKSSNILVAGIFPTNPWHEGRFYVMIVYYCWKHFHPVKLSGCGWTKCLSSTDLAAVFGTFQWETSLPMKLSVSPITSEFLPALTALHRVQIQPSSAITEKKKSLGFLSLLGRIPNVNCQGYNIYSYSHPSLPSPHANPQCAQQYLIKEFNSAEVLVFFLYFCSWRNSVQIFVRSVQCRSVLESPQHRQQANNGLQYESSSFSNQTGTYTIGSINKRETELHSLTVLIKQWRNCWSCQ